MTKHITGIGAAPGVAVGRIVWWQREQPVVQERSLQASEIHDEVARFHQVVETAKEQIAHLRDLTDERVGREEAAVFDAHLAFLEDPTYVGEMEKRISLLKKNAEVICAVVTKEIYEMLAALPDDYLRARADDIHDVGNRLLTLLSGREPFHAMLIPAGAVVVAEELTPSDTVQLPTGIAGIVTKHGSQTGHAAIIARTLGVPMVVGLGTAISQLVDGDLLMMNGSDGTITIHPNEEEERAARESVNEQVKQRKRAMAHASDEAVTADGKRIHVMANIGSLKDVQVAIDHGAEGVGLFRTEFLYLENTHWPTEDEQFEVYHQVLRAFDDKPVIIRTLDIGGDKSLPYATLPTEDNPFLGHRAIRFCLANLDIFKTQLRALLRASTFGNLWIMLPMVENLSEIRATKNLLEACRSELQREGVGMRDQIPVGIMIEVPAAAITADILAKHVDFMSIGTNDLTQYTLAADRGNEKVAYLYNAAHPAVLRLIRQTCVAAEKAGILVGICGELAGDAQMTATLLGLGLGELSMSANAIPEVKVGVRLTQQEKAHKLAQLALEQESAESVLHLIKSTNHQI